MLVFVMAATNGVFSRPPTGKRPDYLPKRRPRVRYRRPDSLPPIQHSIILKSGVSESARSSSEPDGQPRGETMTESHTRDQHLQDQKAVIRPTKPPKKVFLLRYFTRIVFLVIFFHRNILLGQRVEAVPCV